MTFLELVLGLLLVSDSDEIPHLSIDPVVLLELVSEGGWAGVVHDP